MIKVEFEVHDLTRAIKFHTEVDVQVENEEDAAYAGQVLAALTGASMVKVVADPPKAGRVLLTLEPMGSHPPSEGVECARKIKELIEQAKHLKYG